MQILYLDKFPPLLGHLDVSSRQGAIFINIIGHINMTDQETTLLIQEIITKALDGTAQPFKPILYWGEFRYYSRWVRSTKLIIKTLRKSANNLFKEYCKDVIAGISDITKLLAYQQLLDIKDFYENDLKTIQSMLDDYDEYLGDFGNFIKALLGGERDI